jgi:hypothetical protein
VLASGHRSAVVSSAHLEVRGAGRDPAAYARMLERSLPPGDLIRNHRLVAHPNRGAEDMVTNRWSEPRSAHMPRRMCEATIFQRSFISDPGLAFDPNHDPNGGARSRTSAHSIRPVSASLCEEWTTADDGGRGCKDFVNSRLGVRPSSSAPREPYNHRAFWGKFGPEGKPQLASCSQVCSQTRSYPLRTSSMEAAASARSSGTTCE